MRNVNKQIAKELKAPSKFKKWYRKNQLTIKRIIFFPIFICMLISQKIQQKIEKHRLKKNTFSKEKAKKFIDKFLLTMGDLDKEEKSVWVPIKSICDGTFWEQRMIPNYKATKKDQLFFDYFKNEIKIYFLEEYNIEGYRKIFSFTASDKDYLKYFANSLYKEADEKIRKIIREDKDELSILFVKEEKGS